MLTINTKDLADPMFQFRFKREYNPSGMCNVIMSDATIVRPVRAALFQSFMWRAYIMLELPLKSNIWVDITSVNADTPIDLMTHVYKDIIFNYDHIDRMKVAWLLFEAINHFGNFACSCLMNHAQTVDILSVIDACEKPEMKPHLNIDIDRTTGSVTGESRLKESAAGINAALVNKDVMGNNPLYAMAIAKQLKTVQTPQVLGNMAYRSTISNRVPKHPITESVVTGMSHIEDVAIEALAAFMSEYLKRGAIQESQYGGRCNRIVVSPVSELYATPCDGKDHTHPITITEASRNNFIYAAIKDGNETVYLEDYNIDKYVGKEVNLYNPILCRHRYGTCVKCAGWGYGMAHKFVPDDINLAIFLVTLLNEAISQSVLSNKHLALTNSMVYKLAGELCSMFEVVPGEVVLSRRFQPGNKSWYIRVRWEDFPGIDDIFASVDAGENDMEYINEIMSHIKWIQILDDEHRIIAEGDTTCDAIIPCLSTDVIEHIRNSKLDPTDDGETIVINMKGFDTECPLMEYSTISSDITRFANRVVNFFRKDIETYTNVRTCMEDLLEIISDRIDLSVFHLSVIVKSYLLSKDTADWDIPVVEDYKDVVFGKQSEVIIRRSVGMKLAHEEHGSYFRKPETYTQYRGASQYDTPFGVSTISREEHSKLMERT